MGKKRKNLPPDLAWMLADQYENMYIQMIKWTGFDDPIPTYLPERWLYEQGQCVVFREPGTDDIAILPVAYGSEKLDIYGNPREWKAFAIGDSPMVEVINSMKLDATNSVLIWNNQRRMGDAPYVMEIVKKMVDVDKTLDINVLLQRTPYVFKGNQKNLLTVQNVMKDIYDGKQFLLDAGMDIQSAGDVLDFKVEFIGDKLSDQYETYHDRILRYFGIEYLPVEKQERMVTGEVSKNEQEIQVRRQTRLAYRQTACEQIEDLFGVTVTVEYDEPEPEPLGPSDTSAMPGASEGDADAGKP